MKPLPIFLLFTSLLFSFPAHSADDKATLKAALISPRCEFGDVDANLKHFAELAEKAQKQGARLICFPELALVSYSIHPEVVNYAQPIPGPSLR